MKLVRDFMDTGSCVEFGAKGVVAYSLKSCYTSLYIPVPSYALPWNRLMEVLPEPNYPIDIMYLFVFRFRAPLRAVAPISAPNELSERIDTIRIGRTDPASTLQLLLLKQ